MVNVEGHREVLCEAKWKVGEAQEAKPPLLSSPTERSDLQNGLEGPGEAGRIPHA